MTFGIEALPVRKRGEEMEPTEGALVRIRALVVDDEARARGRIVSLLEARSAYEVVGECESGREAALAVAQARPDLVFMDVEMPEGDGFDALEASCSDHEPVVVFVTAYDEHAIRAFDVHAVDYLLKPFTEERFDRALSRVEESLRNRKSASLQVELSRLLRSFDVDKRVVEAAASPSNGRRRMDRILLRTEDRTFFMKVEEIDWIEAADYYAKIHVGKDIHFVRVSLNRLEEQLPPDLFVRIHRSSIVNLERIKELERWVNGSYMVALKDGTKLRMSRGRRDNVADFLGRSP